MAASSTSFKKGHKPSLKACMETSKRMIGNKCHTTPHTQEAKDKISKSSIGKNVGIKNGNWKGGTSRIYKNGYYSSEYINWRKNVFERDNYTCQKCGKAEYVTAHHIKSFAKYPELRFEISNGITLCQECHSLTDNYKGRAKKIT
jgi:hypothetical protein